MEKRVASRAAAVAVALLIGSLLAVGPAVARDKKPPDISEYADDGFGMDISTYFLCNFGYHSVGVGAGAQFAYPVFPSGLISDPLYRDALHVEGGMDFSRWAWDAQDGDAELMIFAPMIGLRYAVYLSETLAPFVSVKIGAAFAMAEGTGDDTSFYWSTSGGVLWDLCDLLSLRGEFGWSHFRDVFRIGILLRL